MAKVDKTQFTKQEWQKIREQRRLDKIRELAEKNVVDERFIPSVYPDNGFKVAFVLGNGVSRKPIDPKNLKPFGKIYGCNALYREFDPDYLVAVDVKMIVEINRMGYQHNHEVWTNPNKSYSRMTNFKFFQPSKGWSSGPTALWLAAQHRHDKIYILGFDYRGIESKVNNIYSDTPNYKRSSENATYYGNWLKQTENVIREHKNIKFVRVIQPDNFCPPELNKHINLKTITVEEFQNLYRLPKKN